MLTVFAAERFTLERARRRLGLRIAITGIRGKSSVTRLIAAGLRGAGLRVLAKTTGSKPAIIFPDGSEEEIRRSGRPSIREQMKVMSLASRLRVDALVVETMSVRPENLSAELKGVLKPHILALTNVRLDHIDALGRDEAAIARSLASTFPVDSVLVMPAGEVRPEFGPAEREGSGLLIRSAEFDGGAGVPGACFRDNIGLALAVLERAGVDLGTGLAGMKASRPDFGAIKAWQVPVGKEGTTARCFSVFAANDPRSSAEAIRMIGDSFDGGDPAPIGLLCLRPDRGDRTLQWIEAARAGFFDRFARAAVLGVPAPAFRRKLAVSGGPSMDKFIFETKPDPKEVMDRLSPAGGDKPVFIGLGNIIGLGEAFIEHWNKTGASNVH